MTRVCVCGLSDSWWRVRCRESHEMMRDKALTPGMSCWDMRGSGSGGPRLGGAGMWGLRERGGDGDGVHQTSSPPTHENQMKGSLDDSLGLWEEEREKKGAHKAVRVRLHLSIMAQCAPDASLLVLVLMNVSIISQHVNCISIDVSNLGLSLTSFVSSSLTTDVDGLWWRKNEL